MNNPSPSDPTPHAPTSLPFLSPYPPIPLPVRVRLTVTPEQPCAYGLNRPAQNRAFWAERLPGEGYHAFMDAGFRRSGKVFYQPVCRGCRACQPIRVPVATFAASKSQRRCWRRNLDLIVTPGEPVPTDEKFDLYRRYVENWHNHPPGEDDRKSFEAFLYDSPVDTVEYAYRDTGRRLLAVGLCDVCPNSLSSVYFYHDPADAKRGLGTFSALYEIEEARRLGIPHYYLGFWVGGCATMDYKKTFTPNEVLHPDGAWRPLVSGEPSRAAKSAPLLD